MRIFSGVNSALTGFGLGGNATDAAPAAYINYILFDMNYKVLDMGWTRVPTSAYFTKQNMSIPQVNVKEAGYIFVYLSYEDQSNSYVQFDDFRVTYTPGNVIQYNEYYPYGLQTANSWTRENNKNNNLYNDGSELNTTSGWYETFFRGYDASLGRFMQVDPLAHIDHSTSPFVYAGNNPALFNDPTGLLKAMTSEGLSQLISSFFNSPFGGTWSSDGGSERFFASEAEAANWGLGNFGSLGATQEYAQAKLMGIATGASWTHWKYTYSITTKNGSNTGFKYIGLGDGQPRGDSFFSAYYNHFEGGIMFNDVEFGLDVLWKSSFKYGRIYKENYGYFHTGRSIDSAK